MTTTRSATAEKLRGAVEKLRGAVGSSRETPADVSKDKEKAEKRRALGRGLESLLPGPRVVAAAQTPAGVPSPSPSFANSANDRTAVDARGAASVAIGTPVRDSVVAGEQGVLTSFGMTIPRWLRVMFAMTFRRESV